MILSESQTFSKENVRQVQGNQENKRKGKILVICENPKHKQRQG